jgi:hypothetical protein
MKLRIYWFPKNNNIHTASIKRNIQAHGTRTMNKHSKNFLKIYSTSSEFLFHKAGLIDPNIISFVSVVDA